MNAANCPDFACPRCGCFRGNAPCTSCDTWAAWAARVGPTLTGPEWRAILGDTLPQYPDEPPTWALEYSGPDMCHRQQALRAFRDRTATGVMLRTGWSRALRGFPGYEFQKRAMYALDLMFFDQALGAAVPTPWGDEVLRRIEEIEGVREGGAR